MFCYKLQNYFATSIYFNQYCKNMNSSSQPNQKGRSLTSIETTQIGASQDCWGCGCCFLDPFKYCLQSAISRFFNIEVNQNVIRIYDNEETKKVVVINGFGTSVFGNEMKNVFLDPGKIEPKQIAYFINQLIKACDENTSDDLSVFNTLCSDKENMKFFACSASAGSFVALSSFLKNQNDTAKKNFFKEVVAKLFPLANEEQRLELGNNAQKLMETIVKKATLVNPPGILFHAGSANYFGREKQSLAVGEGLLVSEKYFINMISEYLSGGFKLAPKTRCLHAADTRLFRNHKNALISSVTDEIVFPFYYVARFAEELKKLNCGLDNDEQISKFVYKVMQYGDTVKKDGGTFELDYFCQVAINELNLSGDKHKEVSDIAKKYLIVKNDYLDLQKTYWQSLQSLQKESPGNPRKINNQIVANNKQVEENFFNSAYEILIRVDYSIVKNDYLALKKTYWQKINNQVIANNKQVTENPSAKSSSQPCTAVSSAHGQGVLMVVSEIE